jgi:hypothetical protein
MIAKTLRTGKPVETVELPLRRRAAVVSKHLPRLMERLGLGGPCAALSATLARRGLWVPPRDLGRLHTALAAARDADGSADHVPAEDLARALAAVRALVPPPHASEPPSAATSASMRSAA